MQRIAVLGAGKIGESLIGGLIDAGLVSRDRVVATARHPERLGVLESRFHIKTSLDNAAAVRGASVVILAVKPQAMAEVLDDIRGKVRRDQLVISVAASVPTAFIEKRLGAPAPVVRAMPNTPCLIRKGMTGLSAGRHAETRHLEVARRLFEPLGRCLILDERHMDAVTAVSGSGPAYFALLAEAMIEAGLLLGLSREIGRASCRERV